MAITPGSASKLNTVKGIACLGRITESDITTHGEKVLTKTADALFLLDDGRIVRNDGTSTINQLVQNNVVVDQLLVQAEKTALSAAFTGGTYAKAAGGVVVHGADGFIADESYGFLDENKKVKLEYLPDSVRAGVTVVSTYDALTSVTDEQKKGLVLVTDASGDETVDSGAAMYQWLTDQQNWLKIAEVESLDIDIEALRPTYENVAASGAVMMDFPLGMTSPSVTDLIGYEDAGA